MNIDRNDGGKTMKAVQLLSPEDIAMPGVLDDIDKAIKYVATIIIYMRKD